MIYGVIDVGSNSVRLMTCLNGKISKEIAVTQLAEGMVQSKRLSTQAIERTANAVSFFVGKAKGWGCQKIFVFATAAVRNSINGADFVKRVKALCDIDVDVISGEVEAQIGVLGALGDKDGGLIDVGGASSEIAVISGGKREYSYSLKLGAVTLTDKGGQDPNVVDGIIDGVIGEYGNVPKGDFYAVGGTATTIASMLIGSEVYRPDLVHGYVVTKNDLEKLKNTLYSTPVCERAKIKGLMPERAKIIASGVSIMLAILNHVGVESFTVSESDNLEGYLFLKTGANYE